MPRMRGRLYSSWASSTWSLPLGADGVLGEDVEDQLRAVDDARLERVLERRCCVGDELVVDEERLGRGLAERGLELLELALADVGTAVGERRCWTSSPTGSTAAVARELVQLGEALFGVDALWQALRR